MAKKTADSRLRTETASRDLLARARAGDQGALSMLFRRHAGALRRWAHGRLPHWARSVSDTTDIVQDALLRTFRRIDVFEDRGKGALEAYLRQVVDNLITDEKRKVARRPVGPLDDAVAGALPALGPSPFQLTLDEEKERRYKTALTALTEDERRLVVGRLELGYTYQQLAAISQRPTQEAARQAVRRAVIKLAERMSGG
jgi:RNA polymerase sigma factor (sigma-70 family)